MPDATEPAPESSSPDQPTLLGNLSPDVILARGLQTVKMTSGAAGMWQPPGVEELARLFPGYEILSLLGRGGMGAVYKARQVELDRMVAIKLLPLEISVNKNFADRFRREARAMAKLHHPNIIAVHDFGTTREGHLFFVMEFVEGANLADIIHGRGMNGEQALTMVEQICSALGYAHSKGVIHRDIKPANVMIDIDGEAKVADFGLARLTDPSAEQMGYTMSGTIMGTPDYMAPEQMKGLDVDHRADIYSLGVVVYEMLCREVPRGAFQPPSVRAGFDPRIDAIVLKAMQPDRESRYQSTQEMKADIAFTRQTAKWPASSAVPPGSPAAAVPHRPAIPPAQADQAAGMDTIEWLDPEPRRSKAVFVSAGILLVAIVGIGGLILSKAMSGTKRSSGSQAPGAAAGQAAPQLEWQKLSLPDADELRKRGNSIDAEGVLHLQTQIRVPSPMGRNMAVRGEVRILEGQSAVSVGLRGGHPVTRRLAIYRSSAMLQLASKEFTNLSSLPYPMSDVVGKWVPFQFAVVDSWSLGTVNSLALAPARSDEAVYAGTVLLAGANGSEAIDLRNLQYVVLDGVPEAQWPEFVRDGMKAAQTGAAAAGEARLPSAARDPEPWHDWLEERRQGGDVPKELLPEHDGYRVVAYLDAPLGRPCRDQAIRVTFAERGASGSLQLQVRVQSGGMMYRARVADAIYLEYLTETDRAQTFATIPLPDKRLRGHNGEMTLELRAVGDLLTVYLDGQVAATQRDASIADGRMQISCAEAWWVKTIEWVSLEKPIPGLGPPP